MQRKVRVGRSFRGILLLAQSHIQAATGLTDVVLSAAQRNVVRNTFLALYARVPVLGDAFARIFALFVYPPSNASADPPNLVPSRKRNVDAVARSVSLLSKHGHLRSECGCRKRL